jgi:hypothetical protein
MLLMNARRSLRAQGATGPQGFQVKKDQHGLLDDFDLVNADIRHLKQLGNGDH